MILGIGGASPADAIYVQHVKFLRVSCRTHAMSLELWYLNLAQQKRPKPFIVHEYPCLTHGTLYNRMGKKCRRIRSTHRGFKAMPLLKNIVLFFFCDILY